MKDRIVHRNFLNENESKFLRLLNNKYGVEKDGASNQKIEVDLFDLQNQLSESKRPRATLLEQISNKILKQMNDDSGERLEYDYCLIARYNHGCEKHADNRWIKRDIAKGMDITAPHHSGNRKWSASIVLNEEYDDGHFRFYAPNKKVKLNTGDMLSFDAKNIHSVDETDGRNRYVVLVWAK